MQKYGLSTIYKKRNSEESKWLKLFFGLPALDASEVEDCFAFIIMSQKPSSTIQGLDLFSDYILNTYILPDSNFPPNLWAFESYIGRTTNACENFHRHFQDKFPSAHPNIFIFLEVLAEEQSRKRIKIRIIATPKRKKAKTKEEKREMLLGKYRKNEILQSEFLALVNDERKC